MKRIFALIMTWLLVLLGLRTYQKPQPESPPSPTELTQTVTAEITEPSSSEPTEPSSSEPTEPVTPEPAQPEAISFDPQWDYASFSLIHTDSAYLYRTQAAAPKGKVICVNAGHGCEGGSTQFTLCHPDGSPKVTGGSTAAGAIKATAISDGTVLNDGTPEAAATLALAFAVRDRLLADGYDVLMVRDGADAQLDNIARTVFANNLADCHIALHYDSTQNDKGLFFIGVPEIASYRSMEPVKSHFAAHIRLGEALLAGARAAGVKIYASGRMDLDLTQTSYSTVPSVDLEVGDRASDHSAAQLEKIAAGISSGLDRFFAAESTGG